MDLEERIQRARRGGLDEITALLHDASVEVVESLLANPRLQDDHLLILVGRKDLPGQLLEAIAKNPKFADSRSVKAALVLNPKTPRLVSLNLLKFLYLFDLVKVALAPAVPAEIKRVAENQILYQMDQLPLGQRTTLARRGPPRVAASLLKTGNPELIEPALENPRMTEAELYRLLQADELTEELLEAIASHRKWSRRYDLRLQLVRHPATPMGLVLDLLARIQPQDLRVLAGDSRLSPAARGCLEAELEQRTRRPEED